MINKKKTKLLMTGSALFLGVTGLAISFLPQEILMYFNTPTEGIAVVVMKIMGGFYIGFGILNWMARANIIGAIYSRPVAVGNFIHFFVGAIVLLREAVGTSYTGIVLPLALINTVFAVSFGYILFSGGKRCG